MEISGDLKLGLQRIRLVVFDVDGVLTDGRLFYTDEGETLKAFHVRDGVALKLLPDMGVDVAIVSAKDSSMLACRMAELGVHHYYPGTKDKRKTVETLARSLNVMPEEVAFVGDDMVDLHAMAWCGVGLAPRDAYEFVRDRADVVVPVNGGHGVARYVADIILQAQDKFEQAYQTASLPHFERDR